MAEPNVDLVRAAVVEALNRATATAVDEIMKNWEPVLTMAPSSQLANLRSEYAKEMYKASITIGGLSAKCIDLQQQIDELNAKCADLERETNSVEIAGLRVLKIDFGPVPIDKLKIVSTFPTVLCFNEGSIKAKFILEINPGARVQIISQSIISRGDTCRVTNYDRTGQVMDSKYCPITCVTIIECGDEPYSIMHAVEVGDKPASGVYAPQLSTTVFKKAGECYVSSNGHMCKVSTRGTQTTYKFTYIGESPENKGECTTYAYFSDGFKSCTKYIRITNADGTYKYQS